MNSTLKIMNAVIIVVVFASTGWSLSINDLLKAAVTEPGAVVSELAVQESHLKLQAATDELYPKISLFAKGERYNSPTNLRPMAPTEVNVAAGESIPFSETIFRYGVEFNMPIYSGKLYLLREKLKLMTQNADIVNRINLTTRQARVVSLNSSFHYLVGLSQAISARMKSLEQTKNDIKLKVDNGRLPETELLKISNSLIELLQQKNDIEVKLLDIKENLKKMTGLDMTEPVAMNLKSSIRNKGALIAVRKNETLLAAAKKERSLQKAAYFPVISLYGVLSGNEGKAYNTDDSISRDYNYVGIAIKIPLFEKSLYTHSSIAGILVKQAQKHLADAKIQLRALEQNLKNKLPVIEKSLGLARQSLDNNEKLLKVAKISYTSGRETTEEYLRYESQVLAAQAAVNKSMDQKWQIIAQQAILYGTTLQGVIQ